MPQFSHLHVHTLYSLLDGASNIDSLYQKAIADNMPAIAITDHGNMFGAFTFVAKAEEYNRKFKSNIKPIVGCEFYLTEDRHIQQFTGGKRDKRYHQLLLAKNAQGYQNLIKLSSLGYIEGLYGKYPRIDKELILKYHEGLIATTCCLAGEVPKTIIEKGPEKAEEVFKWWLSVFGEDYYVELQRHKIPQQDVVNEVLIRFAEKYNVKIIASNDSHYVEKDYAETHDILLCLNTNSNVSTPKKRDYDDDDDEIKTEGRFAFYNDEFYFKTTSEMETVFADLPQAIDNTNEIVDKVEFLNLKKDILLPNFYVPEQFNIHNDSIKVKLEGSKDEKIITATLRNQWEYLKSLTYQGAKVLYGEITDEIRQRIDYELKIIHDMGFAGYFLIVRDFINAANEMDVMVGCGRGSAPGSVVAYCLGITLIDPLKYNLLFERFLNPERISMPDIDVDFDDKGRDKVIDYVVKKYGQNHVAQIITFGSMASKNSIKDVARVFELDLPTSNYLAKLVPDRIKEPLFDIINKPLTLKDGDNSIEKKHGLKSSEKDSILKLREIAEYKGSDKNMLLKKKIVNEAVKVEGNIKSTGIHAAGVLIAPSDLTELLPICKSKKSDMWITQFEGELNEKAGVIKMDFLAIKNLTVIKETLRMVKENYNIDIDINKIPFDDPKVYELYQKGETTGTFQFESDTMKSALRKIRPTQLEDLIAINALNRPGPMEYIDEYALRKHGIKPVTYDLPIEEKVLKETYGITVYQEQVMQLSQIIANFTRGKADSLRKAMGKKDMALLAGFKTEFMQNATNNGHDPEILEKIWNDWVNFAKYAFNKSHSTSYTYLAYQTAYLKTYYPREFMAALLTSYKDNSDKHQRNLDECKRMGINVLGPDINESGVDFTATKKGNIRYGLSAISGFGENISCAIVEERMQNGNYIDIYDLAKRVDYKVLTKGYVELLAKAGAFDSFGDIKRWQICHPDPISGRTFAETIVKFGESYQKELNSQQLSLFGDDNEEDKLTYPQAPECEPWSDKKTLSIEKDVIGIYISGHPLDKFSIAINSFCNATISKLKDVAEQGVILNSIKIAGIIKEAYHSENKRNEGYAKVVIEDYNDSVELYIGRAEYVKHKNLLEEGAILFFNCQTYKKYKSETGEVGITVDDVKMFPDMIESAKSLTVYINILDFDQETYRKFANIIKKNKGSTLFYAQVYDPESKSNDGMFTKFKSGYKVNALNVLELLSEIPSIRVSLHS